MSNLPQHKKTPEELAKLRETLGIPPAATPETHVDSPAEPPPSIPAQHPRTHHSLKRSERAELPTAAPPPPAEAIPHLDVQDHGETTPPPGPKPVRSLKRSEREPAPARHMPDHPVDSGKLPGHRHSDEELEKIRRRSAVAAVAESTYQPPAAASKLLLGLGYFLSLGGALAPTVLHLLAKLTDSYRLGLALSEGYHLLISGCLLALPIAAYIALKKTQSRHHAAFIALIAFFALVFSILHYFPSLKHGA